MTANGKLSMYADVSPIQATAQMTAKIRATMKPSPITATATVQPAKSLKAIWSGLQDSLMDAFVLGGKMYFLNGRDYFCYDGVQCSQVTPYIPTLSISKLPAGGGTLYEDFNLLGAGFKDSFSSDGVAKDYYLSLGGLDATTVTCTVDGVEKVEGTDFTVDRIAGKVTFTTAPAEGTNNVIITAYKTQPGFPERIKKCRFNVLFGGTNDTRVFVSGNPDFPNQMWRSGLYDPTYFPENGFYRVGSDREPITGFSKQYDFLVIEKESSKGNMQYELVNGEPSFPIKPLNDRTGTIATRSIQIIENNPVSLARTGVHILSQSNVRDERNIQHISSQVDPRLLEEPNLKDAVSVDFDRKYWLAVNGNVYVYDYDINQWYIYDNIHASFFHEFEGVLYFGSSQEGLLYRFKDEEHISAYTDDGEAIRAYWQSKLFDFGMPEYRKLVQGIFLNVKPNVHTSFKLYARTDRKGEELLLTSRMDQVNFFTFDFTRFSFVTSDMPQEIKKKVKMKKITHFQFKLENDVVDESLGIMGTSIKYNIQSEIK